MSMLSGDGGNQPFDPASFDPKAGSWLERAVFNHRRWVIAACLLVTIASLFSVRHLQVSANYDKMLPQSHAYIQNFLENRKNLRGLGDSVRVVVAAREGTIFDPDYLQALQKINDEIYLLPGVDQNWMKSIWTPVVRWTEVTEDGFEGGPVMPGDYDGSRKSINALRMNIGRAGVIGSLVSNDFTSSMIVVPLLPPESGQNVDYRRIAEALEDIRTRYESGKEGGGKVTVHVVGFAKLVGDLIDGLEKVIGFFAITVLIAAVILFLYTRCIRSTLLVLTCSSIGVLWQLAIIEALGYTLDPFLILIPFMVFAIGVSHGAQKMNGIMQDTGRGADKNTAARLTFRRLFIAGLTATLCDAVGFAVLMVIDIPVIRGMALAASIGVAVLVFTNLILLPVLLSYTGVGRKAARLSLRQEEQEESGKGIGRLWLFLQGLTRKGPALTVIVLTLAVAGASLLVSRHLQVGDIDAGAPELRPDSRYNLDIAYIGAHYNISSDEFAVMLKTPVDACGDYQNLVEMDRLAWLLRQQPGVMQSASLADTVRAYTSGSFEGNPKWYTIPGDQGILNSQISNAINWNSEFLSADCSLAPVVAYLRDHKAATLEGLVKAADDFAREHSTEDRRFLLAAGSAGVEAATNIVVKESNRRMLFYVYLAVAVLCLIAFRSWRAVIVALVPLAVTSMLAEALMVALGIGLKVATLPVVALGVGIGVDYALYLLSMQLSYQRKGLSLFDAYRNSLAQVGRTVAMVGTTLSASVVTWVWSPIKFQGDMGVLLTFMFASNMVCALVMIPAMSWLLLRHTGAQARAKATGEEVAGA